MILSKVFQIPALYRGQIIGFSFKLESKDYSFDRQDGELNIFITQDDIDIVANKSRAEYELAKLAQSVLQVLAQHKTSYVEAHNLVNAEVTKLRKYFDKPDIVDSTARDITNVRLLNEAGS